MLPWVVIRRFLPYILVTGLLVGAYFYAYNRGVVITTQAFENAILEERNRVNEANREALREARQREIEMSRILRERNATIQNLHEQALEDPNANNPSISPDGVRRLNQLD